ncbi:MAG: hypothetical protein AB7Q97_21760 [Gammaproteobacteria bacterium]
MSRHTTSLRRAACAASFASLMAVVAPANAAATFTASLSFPGSDHDASESNGVAAGLQDLYALANATVVSARASADPNGIGASSGVQMPIQPAGIVTAATGASATFRFDDIVFTNPDAPGSQVPIEVAARFRLHGSFSLLNGSFDTRAFAGVSVDYGLGTGLANAVRTIGSITRQRDRNNASALESGVLQIAEIDDAFLIHVDFVTPTLTVQSGVPVPLLLRIITTTDVVSRDGGAASAAASFHDTLTFAPEGPVFILPEGYTASSAQAGIVDNRLAPVPVPAAGWLLLSALVAAAPAARGRAAWQPARR